MRSALALCFGLAVALAAAGAPPATPEPLTLLPGNPGTVFARLGVVTTVTVHAPKPLEAVVRGGGEINLAADERTITIQPTVPVGLTNVNFRVGRETYSFWVRITTDRLPQTLVAFAAGGQPPADDPAARLLEQSRPMRPAEVDLSGAIRTLERAERDPAFRRSLGETYRMHPLGRAYEWNDCVVELESVHHFPADDLLVFRIQWTNTTSDALHLAVRQYQIWAADRAIPVIARRQASPTAVIFPGQVETAWLAVQGYRLRAENPWELRLPPDARRVHHVRRF